MAEIEKHDAVSYWRCPPLGGPVQFGHCRKVNDGLPCKRVVECWAQSKKLDIAEFLENNYSEEELKQALGGPGEGRMEIIYKTVEESRKPADGKSD